LSERELLATCVMLLVAGHEATVNLIGNGMLALFSNHDQLERLRDEPGLIGSAVEELLRFDSPVQRTGLVATVDFELGDGQIIRAGDRITLLLGAANRDPVQFRDPDTLDLGRSNAGRHLNFSLEEAAAFYVGSDNHYCVVHPWRGSKRRLRCRGCFNGCLDCGHSTRLLTGNPLSACVS
jgi:cytochrome P450